MPPLSHPTSPKISPTTLDTRDNGIIIPSNRNLHVTICLRRPTKSAWPERGLGRNCVRLKVQYSERPIDEDPYLDDALSQTTIPKPPT
jgi:hypothetical protein